MILICGPCVVEDRDKTIKTIEKLHPIISKYDVDFYFKASCVKDNRTQLSNFRGLRFEEAIKILSEIKKEFNVKITTDFHNTGQVDLFGKHVDLLQIPAFLTMQTSLTSVAANYSKVHLKKPQFLSPFKIHKPINKIRDINPDAEIFVTDRGTCFGYDDWMLDPRHIRVMKQWADKVFVDITHPQNHSERYNWTYAHDLAKASLAVGVDGLFLETHLNPQEALCDGDCQIPIEHLDLFLESINVRHK